MLCSDYRYSYRLLRNVDHTPETVSRNTRIIGKKFPDFWLKLEKSFIIRFIRRRKGFGFAELNSKRRSLPCCRQIAGRFEVVISG